MTAHEQAARDFLAAHIRGLRRENEARSGTPVLPPYWTKGYRANHAEYVRGFTSALGAEPSQRSTEGGWKDWHEDGWEAGLEWTQEHAPKEYRAIQTVYALGDMQLSRALGGPFYGAPSWWDWVDMPGEEDKRHKVWRGPKHMPAEPADQAVMMAVTYLQGAVTRWAIRREAGRTNLELLSDIERELGSVHGDSIPAKDPHANEPSVANGHLHYFCAGKVKDTHGHGGPVTVTVESYWLAHSDPKRKIARVRGDKLIGAVRRVFKIPVNLHGDAYFESTGQAVML